MWRCLRVSELGTVKVEVAVMAGTTGPGILLVSEMVVHIDYNMPSNGGV